MSSSNKSNPDHETKPLNQNQNNNTIPAHLDPSTYPRTIHLAPENIHLELTYTPLNPTHLLTLTSSPSAGANILFLGTTRDTFADKPVSQLSYTSYAPLALKTLTNIARSAKDKHGLVAVAVAHRLGVVPVGEASIAISVSAAHRGPAWRAGEEVLELCKERLEVWKREEFVGEEAEKGEWRANKDRDREGNLLQS